MVSRSHSSYLCSRRFFTGQKIRKRQRNPMGSFWKNQFWLLFWLLLLSVLYAKRSMVSTSPDSVGFWSSAQWLSRQGLLGVIMIRPCSYQFILEDVLFCCCMLMISNWLVITPLPYRWSSVAFINYLLWRRWRALSLFLAWRSHILLVDIWYLRSNNVMTWSLELNSMMRRLLTLPCLELYVKLRPTDGSPLSDPTQYRQ